MKYSDGSSVALGDIVSVPVPSGKARGRVVMLGDTYEHLDINSRFLEWVKSERVLERSAIVIEWLDGNPFPQNSRYAPVGDYMFSPVDTWSRGWRLVSD